ncbi:hypothetical protein [Pontibacter burrus]|nr:hypothetical protein [Pontibacter burrus]
MIYKVISIALLYITILSSSALSQGITLDALLLLQKNKEIRINEYLPDRGWSLAESKKTEAGWIELVWEKNANNVGGAVKVSIFKADLLDIIRVRYFTDSNTAYTALKNALPGKNFKYDESLMDNGFSCSNYTDGNTVVMLCRFDEKLDGKELFGITLMSYADYATMYRNKHNTF